MCGRFALTLPKEAMIGLFGARDALGQDAGIARPRYNIRPTDRIVAAHLDHEGGRALSGFRWGFLPHWAKSPKDGPPLINARGETVASKPAFKSSFAQRRCLVPADGFYEWRDLGKPGPKGRPLKQPHWIAPADGAPLVFAGVWRVWRGSDGEEVPSVALVTTAANAAMAPLHDRLPVRLAPADFDAWLDPDADPADLAMLIKAPAEDFYAHHPVSPRISKGGRDAPDDAALIAPVEADRGEASGGAADGGAADGGPADGGPADGGPEGEPGAADEGSRPRQPSLF